MAEDTGNRQGNEDENKQEIVAPASDGDALNPEFTRWLMNMASKASADGSYDYQFQVFCQQLDRFQHVVLPPNNEHSGLTFITRPKLNLVDSALRQSRMLAPLMTMNPSSMGFAIRCFLDKTLAKDALDTAAECPFFNPFNPFMTHLCNGLTNISGFPDPYIQTFTSNPGLFSEDHTIAIGGDNMNKTYDLSLSFSDPQYGMILGTFMAWLEYIRLVTRGLVVAHKEDIDQQRLNYTVSIYRFVMDPNRKYITRYGRAVGCFPKSIPYGSMMNVTEGETFVNSIGQFTIPFTANKVIYDDYAILEDFNALMMRYLPKVLTKKVNEEGEDSEGDLVLRRENIIRLPYTSLFNFSGYPYVFHTNHGIKVDYIAPISTNIVEQLKLAGLTDFNNYPEMFLSEEGVNKAITLERQTSPRTF